MKTKYRNTDLQLVSSHPLDQLNQELEAAGMIVLGHHQGAEGDWCTVLEIIGEEGDDLHDNFEATIVAMMDILEALSIEGRKSLDHCKTLEFNTAFDQGTEPFDFNDGLSSQTVSRMAMLNASFRVTLYSGDTSSRS